MSDRKNRSDRLASRFESDETDETAETAESEQPDKTAQQSNTSQTSKTSKKGESVKDRPSVLMYLPEDIKNELSIRFDEVNAQHKREHGEPLEKNRDFYPAVVEAGITGEDIEDILDI